jgi:hypothetical protein
MKNDIHDCINALLKEIENHPGQKDQIECTLTFGHERLLLKGQEKLGPKTYLDGSMTYTIKLPVAPDLVQVIQQAKADGWYDPNEGN